MLPAHRRYLFVEQCIGSAAVNFAINAAIAWLMFRSAASVPMWGQQSIASDTIGTTFFLPFLTGLIVTRMAQGRLRAGKLPALNWTRVSHPALDWLPRSTFRRSLTLGVACALTAAPPTIIALYAFDVGALHLWPFVAFKASFAAVLAAVVTPVIALWAIAEEG